MTREDEALAILNHLERLAASIGVAIRYESLSRDEDTVSIKSGMCVVRDHPMILVDSRLSLEDRVLAIAKEMKRFDLSCVFVPPIIRQLLENQDTERS